MNSIALVSLEIILIVAVTGMIQLTLLLFRDPFRPRVLRISGMESFAAIFIVSLISAALAFFISGLVNAGVGVPVALLMAVGVPAAAWFALWRILSMKARMARAEAGQSPFRLGKAAPGGEIGKRKAG